MIENREQRVIKPPVTHTYGAVTRIFQVIYVIVAWLFALGVLIQAYLAGMGIFANVSWLKDHSNLGWELGNFSILMLILLFLGRFPRQIILLHLLLIVDVVFQVGLVSFLRLFKVTALTALHPANALLLFGIATILAYRAHKWTRSTRQARRD